MEGGRGWAGCERVGAECNGIIRVGTHLTGDISEGVGFSERFTERMLDLSDEKRRQILIEETCLIDKLFLAQEIATVLFYSTFYA